MHLRYLKTKEVNVAICKTGKSDFSDSRARVRKLFKAILMIRRPQFENCLLYENVNKSSFNLSSVRKVT